MSYIIEDFFDWNAETDFQNQLKTSVNLFEYLKNNKISNSLYEVDCFFDSYFVDLYTEYYNTNSGNQFLIENLNMYLIEKLNSTNRTTEFFNKIYNLPKTPAVESLFYYLSHTTFFTNELKNYFYKNTHNEYLDKYLEIFPQIKSIIEFDHSQDYSSFLINLKFINKFKYRFNLNFNKIIPMEFYIKNKDELITDLISCLNEKNTDRTFFIDNALIDQLCLYHFDKKDNEFLFNELFSNASLKKHVSSHYKLLNLLASTFIEENNVYILEEKFKSINDISILSTMLSSFYSHSLFVKIVNQFIVNNIDTIKFNDSLFTNSITNEHLCVFVINQFIKYNKELDLNKNYLYSFLSFNIWNNKNIDYENLKDKKLNEFILKKLDVANFFKKSSFLNLLIEKKSFHLLKNSLKYKKNRENHSILIPLLNNNIEIDELIINKLINEKTTDELIFIINNLDNKDNLLKFVKNTDTLQEITTQLEKNKLDLNLQKSNNQTIKKYDIYN